MFSFSSTIRSIIIGGLLVIYTPIFAVSSDTEAVQDANSMSISNITPHSVELSWEPSNKFTGYTIHFGTKSAKPGLKYEKFSDILSASSTGTTLKNLKEGTEYFLVLAAYDKNANESPVSDEVTFTTTKNLSLDNTLPVKTATPVESSATSNMNETKVDKPSLNAAPSERNTSVNSTMTPRLQAAPEAIIKTEKLPKTGPDTVLMIIFSLIGVGIFFGVQSKKI